MSGAEPSRRALIGGALAAGVAAAIPAKGRDRGTRRLITCSAGRFSGTDEASGVTAFRGIRYGRAARFRAPAPFRYGRDVHHAEDFAPACPQRGKYRLQSEDCLFLNIWTCLPERRGARPVLLYIHGGAYANGSVTDPLNDGRALAARDDVVVVTVNHRLNALGYLYIARLDPRFPDSGNCGQLDLILALRWVRDNIAAFGGDPDRVMLFGQSGGGAKIATLMGTPAAEGLFQRAATMSGQQVTVSGPRHATARARAYLAKLGVGERDLSPLLALPVDRLLEGLEAEDPVLGGAVYMGPVLDMRSLDRHPFWPDANPIGLSVPLLLGNTHDETRGLIAPDSGKVRTLGWDNLAERIAEELPVDILPEHVVAEYRRREPGWTPQRIFYAATTAGRSWRGQVIEAEARARGGAPAWVYQVDFTSRTNPELGAFHCIDIPLVFGTLDAQDAMTGTGADARAVSRTMQDAFVAFARTGNPNAGGIPRWPSYDLDSRATMIVDSNVRIENDPRGWQRDLFARVPYVQPGT